MSADRIKKNKYELLLSGTILQSVAPRYSHIALCLWPRAICENFGATDLNIALLSSPYWYNIVDYMLLILNLETLQ